ncbi:TonB-dependent receptor plug domain-containing protein [Steroidobacter agaridevorans]|uniref:TonB-dependent receptor plug domain-containing protein n=1 Tax=Steroidobacter agaridevorans TaxID=2695856 RepID=UPI001326FE96|nr:TonB-dependent receptor [Steroidobacter agaridevorans]GFE88755.1 TonB-dependent receptor [Steroidobacter agaridevorans]
MSTHPVSGPTPRASSRLLTLSVALLLHPAWSAMAADMQDGVEDVIVTANRIAQETSRVGDSVTVITAKEQRLSQKTAVSDLLALTPGVTVARNGGFGGTTTIRIRGAESHQTMVLIDGVKLNDPSSASGEFNFADLITTDFAQIEVLRGPQSTLWGSQAIGGVVNIVTPVPEGPLSASVSAEGGTHETAIMRAHAQAGGDRFAWRVSGNYLTSDGISAYSRDLGGREPDGYRNVGFTARGILHITDNVSAEIRSTWSDGRSDYDGFVGFNLADTPEYGTTEELTTYAGVKFDVFDGRFENRIGFAYTDTDRKDTDPSSTVPTTFDADGRNERWEYQGTLRITERVSTIVGLESERSELSSASPTTFDPDPAPLTGEVQIDSAYAQVNVTPIDALSLTAGVRYDDHDTFGGHTTTRASAAWSVTPSTILRASYGEGFKAPTLYQLYSLYGNLNLDAEEAESWDAGIEQHFFDKQLVVSATYFDRDTTNMIDFVSCWGETSPDCLARPDGYYDNFQQTNAHGVELAMAAHLTEQLSLTVNYTNMDAENTARGTANFGHSLPRRPDETTNAQVSYEWPVGLTTTVAVQHASRSFDTISNAAVLDGYTLVDFRASLAVSDSLEVYGRIENAFDEEYETVKNYGTLGRTFYAGLRQSF